MIRVVIVNPDKTEDVYRYEDSDLASLFNLITSIAEECDKDKLRMIYKITLEKKEE